MVPPAAAGKTGLGGAANLRTELAAKKKAVLWSLVTRGDHLESMTCGLTPENGSHLLPTDFPDQAILLVRERREIQSLELKTPESSLCQSARSPRRRVLP